MVWHHARQTLRCRRGNALPEMRRLAAISVAVVLALRAAIGAEVVRVTTWNMEWFPSGSPGSVSEAIETARIGEAANHLQALDSDVLLLQEVRDWQTCERLVHALLPLKYEVLVCSAFRDRFSGAAGRQQVAVVAKRSAQAAWAEQWHASGRVDPPRGFAFASIQFGDFEVGFYCVHLKSNLVRRNDPLEPEMNIAKREVAVQQIVDHVREMQTRVMPSISQVVIAGDFNTNKDQSLFVSERTLDVISDAGFRDVLAPFPLASRITHPGTHGYPDATFDYIFVKGARRFSPPNISGSEISDHRSLTCDIDLAAAQRPAASQGNALLKPGETKPASGGNRPLESRR